MDFFLSILDFVPVVGMMKDAIGLIVGVGVEPSASGVMAKLIWAVVFAHEITPYLERFVKKTKTELDDRVLKKLLFVLGWTTELLIAFGKFDRKEITKKIVGEKKKLIV